MKTRLKAVVLGLALISLFTGISACARRPVVLGSSSAPSPSAAVSSGPAR
jgi:hypothetical protein